MPDAHFMLHGLVHINDIVVSTYEIHQMHIHVTGVSAYK